MLHLQGYVLLIQTTIFHFYVKVSLSVAQSDNELATCL